MPPVSSRLLLVNQRNTAKTAILQKPSIWHSICIFLFIIRGRCAYGVRVATHKKGQVRH
jgi:hypothetical protein